MSITQKRKSLALSWQLCAAFVVAFVALATPDLVYATNNDTPIGDIFCVVVNWFTGNTGRGLATIAVTIIGIGALLGKVSWGMALIVGLGIGHPGSKERVLGHVLGPVIVYASVVMAVAILLESALAFLRLSDPNVASWGNLIGLGRDVLRVQWYVSAIPGVAILVTVLAVSLVGQGLNDALNPRLKRR